MLPPDTTIEQTAEDRFSATFIREPVFYSSPARLRAAAHLYGIESVPVEKARVLALGCGTGTNLLPFALAYPNASVTGVDVWPEEIKKGLQIVKDLDLHNLDLRAMPYTSVNADLGEFDYIIVHDAFTWAPPAAREAMLRICQENLSPLGIAFISYNTYPGWNAGDVLRDAIQLHSSPATTIEDILPRAMAMLDLMSDGLGMGNPHAHSLTMAVQRFRQHPDYYINGEYLQATNCGFYFIEFANAALQAGLAYVGDAQPEEELSVTPGRNVQLTHSLIAMGQPKVVRQQYLDFAVGRQFRRSLFIRQERAESIFDNPDLNRFRDLHWAGSFRRNEQGSDTKHMVYSSYQGKTLSLKDPTEIAIVELLSAAWPRSISFQQIVAQTKDVTLDTPDEQAWAPTVQRALANLFNTGELRYCLGQGPYDGAVHQELCLIPGLGYFSANAQVDAKHEKSRFNLWHDSLTFALDSDELRCLNAFDGKNNFPHIAAQLSGVSALECSQLNAADTGKMPRGRQLSRLVDLLRRQGALSGSQEAWLNYFKMALSINAGESFYGLSYLNSLVLDLDSSSPAQGGKSTKARPVASRTRQEKRPSAEAIQQVAALRKKQQLPEAELLAKKLTTEFPHDPVGWNALSQILFLLGRPKEGMAPLFEAIALNPRKAELHSNLSTALLSQKIDIEAGLSARRALKLDANHATAWIHLGNIFRHQKNPSQAESCYRRALKIRPDYTAAYSSLGSVCAEQQRLEEASTYYKRVLEIDPNNLEAHSNWLFILSQHATISTDELFEVHCAFGIKAERKASGVPTQPHSNSRDPNRVLRLGFVSGDLRKHAVASFIEPIWKFLNKERYEIYAFDSSDIIEDEMSQRLRTYTKGWSRIAGMGDSAVAKQIRNTGIDILFDLSGHTGYNRLPMFALKPAPVQISWIGYPATTGLEAMDYFLVDKYKAPAGQLDTQFTERLIRLPVTSAFQPAANSPNVNGLPALASGHFTYGSFNRLSKTSEGLIILWARILKSVPSSRLLLGNIVDSMSKDIVAQFLKYGIDADRLSLHPRANIHEYLCLHHQVDLLLDTFPYNGGTTTHHGLWMGVPTLTLAGDTLPGRTGVSIMNHAKLDGFIAYSQDEYMQKAIEWSGRTDSLAAIRANMRKNIEASPERSHEYVTKGLEAALQTMWRMWCEHKRPESFEVET